MQSTVLTTATLDLASPVSRGVPVSGGTVQHIYRSPVTIPPTRTGALADFCFEADLRNLREGGPKDTRVAFIDAPSGTVLSRSDLLDASLRLAFSVRKRGYEFKAGVAMIFSPNSLAWPITFLGLQSAGVCTTTANASYTPPELAHQIKDSGATLFFVHPANLAVLNASLDLLRFPLTGAQRAKNIVIMDWLPADREEVRRCKIGPEYASLRAWTEEGKLDAPIKLADADTDATAIMCYSSGTTGLSKGVETTHRNVVTLLQIFEPTSIQRLQSDVQMAVAPFYHVLGAVQILCAALWSAMPTVVMAKFDPEFFCATIERYRISFIKVVPPVLVMLANHAAVDTHDLSSLRFISTGGAVLSEHLVDRLKKRFDSKGWGKLGFVICQGYGLTEASPTTHNLPPAYSFSKMGSIGIVLPSLEVRLVSSSSEERDVPPICTEYDVVPNRLTTQPGELWIRGKTIMKGYLNNPKATAEAIDPEGWFKTGDIAVADVDGFFYIVDRKKELIKYKGFQVPPADLEAVLLAKDDIIDAGVIGIHSGKEDGSELPRAYVVSSRNAELMLDPERKRAWEREVEEWIKTRVARHKWLRGGVCLIEAVPKSPSGKILRKDLRELAKREMALIQARSPPAPSTAIVSSPSSFSPLAAASSASCQRPGPVRGLAKL